MSSYFQSTSADRVVTVWPCVTGESAFYDVVYGDTSGEDYVPMGTADRVTAREAACYIVTEIGCPFGATIETITRQIAVWRAGETLRSEVAASK
ncbi:hypothetical protein [Ilumatobacter sp.]|uniref:hypothetical protein n=1 Tax=Ilumatobacter sp. TaxID=1967498 RepID=UPI003752C8A0